MLKNKLLIALAIAAFSNVVLADDKVDYSFGIRSWNHKFKETVTTQHTSASIVTATAKKGNYFVAASFLMPTTYSYGTAYIIRKDTDLAFGYSINPNISVLLGTKRISIDQSSSTDSTMNATYIGANGFTSLGEETFLFGQLTRSINLKDSSIPAGYKVTYSSYEAGLGYVLNKNTQITGGYRTQIFDPSPSGTSTTLTGIIFGVTITP